jgi:hypothetical protein
MVVPEWIRSVGNGRVELLAGREPEEATYIAELFLYPNYTETTPMDTAAPWFTALLTSQDGSFHTLIKSAQCLDNLAVVAEIYHYHDLIGSKLSSPTSSTRSPMPSMPSVT